MNRCHKPLMKRPHLQKQGPVISVVKAAKDVSLIASSAEEKEVEANLQVETSPSNKDGVLSQVEVLEIEKEVDQVAGLKKKKNSRSRSRRRSRSREKARALSSPPEVLEITNNEIRVRSVLEVRGDEVQESRITKNQEDDNIEKKDLSEELRRSEKVKGKKQIQYDPGEEEEDEKSPWITKHSKAYRRAMRQMELWKASGGIGTPIKSSSKFLIRGGSSGKRVGF